MFCTKCGKEMPENVAFCPECGTPTGLAAQNQSNFNSNQPDNTEQFNQFQNPVNFTQAPNGYGQPPAIDEPNTIINVAACCFPIIGLILYLVWKDTKPKSAGVIWKWALGGFLGGIAIYIFFFILSFILSSL